MSSRLALAAVTALLQDMLANRLAEVLGTAAPPRTGTSGTGPVMSQDSSLAGRAGHR